MNVLSLFDGISCARVALDRVGIKVKTYFACEIEKNAIKVSRKNYPDSHHLGDVRQLHTFAEPIHLLIGGSPCQDLSIAKKERKGLEGERSSLFWDYIRIRDIVKPTYFVLENVASMPKKDRDIISQELGVEPILINASLVSAQSRKRLFWTNIPGIVQPVDRGILLKDILQPDAEVDESMTVNGKSFCLTASYSKTGDGQNEYEHNKKTKQRTMVRGAAIRGRQNEEGVWIQTLDIRGDEKANAVVGFPSKTSLVNTPTTIRKLTPMECERLQGLPDNYTEGIPKTQRYKCIGNAFNVDVVAHILKHLPVEG